MSAATDEVRHGDALPEVHVRVCPKHHIRVKERSEREDRLWCPGILAVGGRYVGGHYVEDWKVVDTRSSKAVALAHEDRVPAGAQRGIEDLKEPLKKLPTAAALPPEKRTLDRAKYEQEGETLWLRALRVPNKHGGDPFRVAWTQTVPGAKGKKAMPARTAQGIIATMADETECRMRFKAALADAVKAGWTEARISSGGRKPLVFRPIPKPGSLRG